MDEPGATVIEAGERGPRLMPANIIEPAESTHRQPRLDAGSCP
jgi:hypothetical protein